MTKPKYDAGYWYRKRNKIGEFSEVYGMSKDVYELTKKGCEERVVTRFAWLPFFYCGSLYWLEDVTYLERRRIEQCYGYYNDWFIFKVLS